MIELRLLGTVELRRADGAAVQSVAVQPKRLALLAYLAVARPRGPHRRDTLLGLFWPELDTDRGRAALSKALHHLRLALGAGAIVSRGEEAVQLDDAVVVSDAARFEEALQQGRLEDALQLHAGDLLQGVFVSDAPGFDRWLDSERARLRARAAEAANTLAGRSEAAGEMTAAVAWARRALDLAGDDELALRRLMSLLDAVGDRAGALTAYDAFAATMLRELEVEPSPETQALADTIRRRSASPASDAATDAGPDARDVRGAEAAPGAPPVPGEQPVKRWHAPPVVEAAPAGQPAGGGTDPPSVPRWRGMLAGRRRTALASAASLAVIAVVVLGALAYRAVSGPTAFLEPRRVLVLPFDNRTLDAALEPVGRMVADWIIDGISRMGGFEVVPSTAVWAAQGGATETEASGAVRRLARETGAGTVLSGSYYLDGGRVILHARVHDASTGQVLRPIGGVSTAADSVMHGIDLLRTRVLAAMAPVGDTVYHLRLAAAPPTYDAYREYITAMGAFVTGNPALALRHYERAAAADGEWAMPRIAAAIMHMNLDDWAAADSIIAPLDAARERLGPLERGTVDMVLGMLRGDQRAVYTAVTGLSRIAPGTINEYMVAEMARKLNRPAEALAVLARLGAERGELRGWRPYWREAAWSHHMLGDHRRELAVVRRARALYPHDADVLALEVQALAAMGRVADVRARIDERVASPSPRAPSAGDLMSIAARELEWHGHPEPAAELAVRAVAWYRDQPAHGREDAAHRSRYARALMDAGQFDEAARVFEALLREAPGDPVRAAWLGLALAESGDRAGAETRSAEAGAYEPRRGRSGLLNTMYGEHTLVRAAIAAHLGDRPAAIRLLLQAESEGLVFTPAIACSRQLAPLRGDPAFEAWRRPRSLPRGR
jgi:DNA-binding SARP family transcriptional activator/TolB-like protein